MTVDTKFESVRALIQEHNQVVGDANPGFISVDEFLGNIKAAGGTTEDRLKNLTYEDLLAILPVTITPVGGQPIKPIALIKDIAKIFRGTPESTENRPVTTKKAEKMTLRQLVEAYDPEDADNPVGKRLSEISKDEPFLVYFEGRTVDVDTSFKLLKEIKDGFEGREHIEDEDGEIKETYCVGELPDHFLEENPLYRDRPLRPDGTCDQTGRSWAGIDMSIRQFIRLAMDVGELEDISIDKAHDILDMVVNDKALSKLKKRYRKTAIEFDKKQKTGDLPKLKLTFGREEVSSSDRPFDKPKKVEFTSEWANMYYNKPIGHMVQRPEWKKGEQLWRRK